MKFAHSFLPSLLCLGMLGCNGGTNEAPVLESTNEGANETQKYDGPTYIVGTELAFPPFALMGEDGRISGYDVDLITAIADKQEMNIEVKILPWGDWLPSLKDDSVDIWVSGIAITPEREEMVSFSDPYINRSTLAVTQGDGSIDTINKQTISGLRIAVQSGTPDYDYVADLVKDTDATIVPVISNYIGITSILTDKADILIGNDKVIKYHLNQHPEVSLETLPIDALNTEIALTVRKNREALVDELNAGLDKVMNDEALYSDLNNKWFGESQVYIDARIHTDMAVSMSGQ